MIGFKLTDADGWTRKGFSNAVLWAPGVVRRTTGAGQLCTSGWTHFYEDPLLAMLHDPIHCKYGEMGRLWEIEADENILRDFDLKSGATYVRCLREIEKPEVDFVKYALLISCKVYPFEEWLIWTNKRLRGIKAPAPVIREVEMPFVLMSVYHARIAAIQEDAYFAGLVAEDCARYVNLKEIAHECQ